MNDKCNHMNELIKCMDSIKYGFLEVQLFFMAQNSHTQMVKHTGSGASLHTAWGMGGGSRFTRIAAAGSYQTWMSQLPAIPKCQWILCDERR